MTKRTMCIKTFTKFRKVYIQYSLLRRNHHNHYWSIQHQKSESVLFGDQPLIKNVFPGVNPENLMVPGPPRLRNIHGSQINIEPDIHTCHIFSSIILPLMMSDGLGWTTAPSSTIPDGLTPILRFLHSSPARHSGADLQAAVVPLQIADLHSFGARGDKLVS